MTPAQIAALRGSLGIREGHEFERWEGDADPDALARAAGGAPFFAGGARRLTAPPVEMPPALPTADSRGNPLSTQMASARS